ncbi:glutathione S-transferase T1-like isoform X2 [Coffea arabica]|uniref:Glutathione S-transferase T1-like isoform X2 n=1 Tax=Coffea arabica TaxID=13443 RepID=A0ABM4VKP7_COFAR
MKLKVFADRGSQPARAVLIFCKANGIEFEEVQIQLAKGEHKSPEYEAINPMKQVPAIEVDGKFRLFESHAILRFLATAFPGIAEHWYPADVFKRAQIDSALDWHHSTIRRGSVGVIHNTTLAPLFGRPLDPQAAAEAEKLLSASLAKIESFWLKGDGPFLLGNSEPSMADLSLVCEIMQLELGFECSLWMRSFRNGYWTHMRKFGNGLKIQGRQYNLILMKFMLPSSR